MTDEPLIPVGRLRRERRDPPSTPQTLLHESPWALAVRDAKRAGLSVARRARWLREPSQFAPPALDPRAQDPRRTVLEERVTIGRDDPHAHPAFEHGKRHNLRLAIAAFDGLALDPSRVFSFWRTLGPLTAERGFIAGMELRGGCVVPSVGGGVCLLSNALFRLALRAGFRVVERYGHSLEAVPPRAGECWGADATVAWPHIDLRFAPIERAFTLRARIDPADDTLVLSLESDSPLSHRVELRSIDPRTDTVGPHTYRVGTLVRVTEDLSSTARSREVIATDRKRVLAPHELGRSCLTCNESACHAREPALALVAKDLR
jgi:vancomycin resistance protein VanW